MAAAASKAGSSRGGRLNRGSGPDASSLTKALDTSPLGNPLNVVKYTLVDGFDDLVREEGPVPIGAHVHLEARGAHQTGPPAFERDQPEFTARSAEIPLQVWWLDVPVRR